MKCGVLIFFIAIAAATYGKVTDPIIRQNILSYVPHADVNYSYERLHELLNNPAITNKDAAALSYYCQPHLWMALRDKKIEKLPIKNYVYIGEAAVRAQVEAEKRKKITSCLRKLEGLKEKVLSSSSRKVSLVVEEAPIDDSDSIQSKDSFFGDEDFKDDKTPRTRVFERKDFDVFISVCQKTAPSLFPPYTTPKFWEQLVFSTQNNPRGWGFGPIDRGDNSSEHGQVYLISLEELLPVAQCCQQIIEEIYPGKIISALKGDEIEKGRQVFERGRFHNIKRSLKEELDRLLVLYEEKVKEAIKHRGIQRRVPPTLERPSVHHPHAVAEEWESLGDENGGDDFIHVSRPASPSFRRRGPSTLPPPNRIQIFEQAPTGELKLTKIASIPIPHEYERGHPPLAGGPSSSERHPSSSSPKYLMTYYEDVLNRLEHLNLESSKEDFIQVAPRIGRDCARLCPLMFPEEAQYTTFWEEIVKKIFSSPSSSFLKKASKLLSPKKSQVESKANLILFLEACVKGLETPAGGYLMYVLNDPQARYSTKMEGDQDFTQSMYGKKRHDIFQRYKAFVESPNLKDVGVDLRLRSQGASASGAWGDPALPASLKTIDPSGWERHHRAQTETPVERRSHGEEQSGPSTAL